MIKIFDCIANFLFGVAFILLEVLTIASILWMGFEFYTEAIR